MRILLMTEYLPPQIHGIATRFEHHIAHLRQLGHTVHVAGPETCPLATIPLAVTPLYAFNPDVKTCILSASNVSHIMGITPTIDVVHIVCPATPSFYGLLPFFGASHIPVVCSHHCDPSQFTSLLGTMKPIVLTLMEAWYVQFEPFVAIHLFPTITQENNTYLSFAKRVDVIPTGIDSQLFHPHRVNNRKKARCKTLLYVGRLSPEKDCETMLRFFKRLVALDGYGDYRLRIVGDGPSRESLQQMCREENIANIDFVGFVAHRRLPKHYRTAQAFVTFSVTEMYGFTNLEALACGTPIIYPACDTFDRYYQKDFPQTRFTTNDFSGFKRAVDFTYQNTKLRQKAVEFCADKDWHSATRRLCEIYKSVVK